MRLCGDIPIIVRETPTSNPLMKKRKADTLLGFPRQHTPSHLQQQ
jgi:hypothetical protein